MSPSIFALSYFLSGIKYIFRKIIILGEILFLWNGLLVDQITQQIKQILICCGHYINNEAASFHQRSMNTCFNGFHNRLNGWQKI